MEKLNFFDFTVWIFNHTTTGQTTITKRSLSHNGIMFSNYTLVNTSHKKSYICGDIKCLIQFIFFSCKKVESGNLLRVWTLRFPNWTNKLIHDILFSPIVLYLRLQVSLSKGLLLVWIKEVFDKYTIKKYPHITPLVYSRVKVLPFFRFVKILQSKVTSHNIIIKIFKNILLSDN